MPLPDEILHACRDKLLVVSDVETDGLLKGMSGGGDHPPMTRIHCATANILDPNTLERVGHRSWTPDNIGEYHEWLNDEVGVVVGHNFVSFDNRAIKFVYPKYRPPLTLDTLPMCKMVWPADVLIGPDMRRFHMKRMPAKYIKRHSLGAWGYRLGNYKGEYDGGWLEWSPAMHEYMEQDGHVNEDLFRLIARRMGWSNAQGDNTYVWPYLPVWIEMEMARIIADQEEIGVGFDMGAATALSQDLKNQQAALTDKLRKVFGAWWAPKLTKGTRTTTKDTVRVRKDQPLITGDAVAASVDALYVSIKGKKPPKSHYVGTKGRYQIEFHFAGAKHTPVELTEFNPSSRTHLADRLQRVFGWKPEVFTENGAPQVDETAIKGIPSSLISEEFRKIILDYFVVTKSLGQLVDGKKSYMYFVNEHSAIQGRVDPLGTITNRAAHYNPNLGQVPAVSVDETKDGSGKVIAKVPIKGLAGGFGWEFRSLFKPAGLLKDHDPARDDMVEMTGSDISGLEFVMLGHYLYKYDGGKFAERASDPTRDLHAEHSQWVNEVGVDMTRSGAKTLGFLIIYGGGALKAGKGLGVEEHEIPELLLDKGLPMRLRFMKKRLGRAYEEPTPLDKARIVKGARGIKAIKDVITGLPELMAESSAFAEENGYVIAIDGRKLVTRKPYAALNTRLQGSGSVACKLWIILTERRLAEQGIKLRVDYNMVLWVHDETQKEHRKGLGPIIGEASQWAAGEAARMLKLKGTLRTESKTGTSWAETH